VFFVALGIAASSSLRTEHEATLKPGESMTVHGQTVRLKSMWGRLEKQRSVVGATMELMSGNSVTGTLEPRMNFYPTQQEPVPTPDVQSGPGGDLYLNLVAFRDDGSNATIKAIYEPLLGWIWFGGGVVVLGAFISGWPSRKRRAVVPVAMPARKTARDAA
jgi:cytochrome c-type biogenesis protein CcmF